MVVAFLLLLGPFDAGADWYAPHRGCRKFSDAEIAMKVKRASTWKFNVGCGLRKKPISGSRLGGQLSWVQCGSRQLPIKFVSTREDCKALQQSEFRTPGARIDDLWIAHKGEQWFDVSSEECEVHSPGAAELFFEIDATKYEDACKATISKARNWKDLRLICGEKTVRIMSSTEAGCRERRRAPGD